MAEELMGWSHPEGSVQTDLKIHGCQLAHLEVNEFNGKTGLYPVLGLFFKGDFKKRFVPTFSQVKNPRTVLQHTNGLY